MPQTYIILLTNIPPIDLILKHGTNPAYTLSWTSGLQNGDNTFLLFSAKKKKGGGWASLKQQLKIYYCNIAKRLPRLKYYMCSVVYHQALYQNIENPPTSGSSYDSFKKISDWIQLPNIFNVSDNTRGGLSLSCDLSDREHYYIKWLMKQNVMTT